MTVDHEQDVVCENETSKLEWGGECRAKVWIFFFLVVKLLKVFNEGNGVVKYSFSNYVKNGLRAQSEERLNF